MQVISHGYGWNVDSWISEITVNKKKFTALAEKLFRKMIRLACGNTVVWSNTKALAQGVCSERSAQRFLALFAKAEIIRPASKIMYGHKITGWEFLAHPVIEAKMQEAHKKRQKRKTTNECNGSVQRGRESIPDTVLGHSKGAYMDLPGAGRDYTDNRPLARQQATCGGSLYLVNSCQYQKMPEETGINGFYQYQGADSLLSNHATPPQSPEFISGYCAAGTDRAASFATPGPFIWSDYQVYNVIRKGDNIAAEYSGAPRINSAVVAGKSGSGADPSASISGVSLFHRPGPIHREEIQVHFQRQIGACSRQIGVTSRQIGAEKDQKNPHIKTENQYDNVDPSRARNKYNININIIPPFPPTQSQAPADTKNEGKQEEVRTNSLLNSSLAAWDAACTHLQQKLSGNDFELWIKPIQATETEAGLRLDCQDRFHLAGVQERFGTDIRDAMQLTENTKFYFSFGEKEREIQEENERKERIRAAQLVIQQRQALQKMSAEEQFTMLFDNYPPHRRSFSDKQPAFMIFQEALKRGETSIFALLTALKRQKVSDLWQKDQGRWIPGIGKWLGERRWADTL